MSVVQYLLLRWGLSPLKQLADEVSTIESGQIDMLQGHYPSELQAVSDNLNLLIKSERDRQKRYQTTLGDLAHSLKTPLAVISGVVQEKAQDKTRAGQSGLEEIHEQVERMNQIVGYQLKRAVKSQQNPLMAKQVNVQVVIQKLLTALTKVYRDKAVEVSQSIPEKLHFPGEESDLMELCGNLLDNAFKYTRSAVKVEARRDGDGLHIVISDNGKGIDDSAKQWVLERGARADTVVSGQGIGLAVAVDIISSYGGRLEVGEASSGGALIQVWLPG
jgi:two-component system sensor histidine kinase PhoQ